MTVIFKWKIWEHFVYFLPKTGGASAPLAHLAPPALQLSYSNSNCAVLIEKPSVSMEVPSGYRPRLVLFSISNRGAVRLWTGQVPEVWQFFKLKAFLKKGAWHLLSNRSNCAAPTPSGFHLRIASNLTIWNRYVVYYVLSQFYDNDVEYETFLNTYFSVNQCKNVNKIKRFVKSLEWHHLKRILVQVWKKKLSQFLLMIWSYLFLANC